MYQSDVDCSTYNELGEKQPHQKAIGIYHAVVMVPYQQ